MAYDEVRITKFQTAMLILRKHEVRSQKNNYDRRNGDEDIAMKEPIGEPDIGHYMSRELGIGVSVLITNTASCVSTLM